MKLVFADDAEQAKPRRDGIRRLVAFGGLMLDGDRASDVERLVESYCERAGFPPGEEFKWSPGKNDWMRDHLVEDERSAFFCDVLGALNDADAEVIVILEDCQYRTAIGNTSAEFDVVTLFIERAEHRLDRADQSGLIIADETGGGRENDTTFMQACQELLGSGTKFVRPDHIALNVLCGRSNMVRMLQAADLVTSCLCSYVSGSTKYAPDTARAIKPLLRSVPIGGRSVKIHPDFVYANLYHWLFGDDEFWRFNTGQPLPIAALPYAASPDER